VVYWNSVELLKFSIAPTLSSLDPPPTLSPYHLPPSFPSLAAAAAPYNCYTFCTTPPNRITPLLIQVFSLIQSFSPPPHPPLPSSHPPQKRRCLVRVLKTPVFYKHTLGVPHKSAEHAAPINLPSSPPLAPPAAHPSPPQAINVQRAADLPEDEPAPPPPPPPPPPRELPAAALVAPGLIILRPLCSRSS
jgi:hypothetical protein